MEPPTMRVWLDDVERHLEGETVGEVLSAAAQTVEPDGRVITDVVVDGEPWEGDRLTSPDHLGRDADEVHLVTADLLGLLGQTIEQTRDVLNELESMQEDAAAAIQRDETARAMALLGDITNLWMSVQQATSHVAEGVSEPLAEMRTAEGPARETIERFGEHLRTLVSAIESGDASALADVLLFDLTDTAGQWRGLLDVLEARVEERRRERSGP